MSSDQRLSRRSLLSSSASALLISNAVRAAGAGGSPLLGVSGQPSTVIATTENDSVSLRRNATSWQSPDMEVTIKPRADESHIALLSARQPVLRIHLRWQLKTTANLQFLGDDWERSYGTLGWRGMDPERILPWYLLAYDGASTVAIGVKTAPAAFCFWQVDPAGVSLWLDVRNGGRGLHLQQRQLHIAALVTKLYPEAKPFEAAKDLCRRLSPEPRLPARPVYGGNNWYYAYGNSSAVDIRDDSKRLASLATSHDNRPFMVIDDGWSPNKTAGPWSHGNARFPDMPGLASQMRSIGVRPGLWLRPLFTKEEAPASWRLRNAYTIDPSVPEATEKIRQDIRTAVSWGYELIKNDFSTFDLLGRWGFRMGAEITDSNWNFANQTRTNAEIIRDFYGAIRESAGNATVLGCNTVGHLSAGLFELQRIGDDTSGRDWNRTRKMGVNTLAFRAPQHNAFFAVDADCVGLTKQIPWRLNRQWLHLLAHSGTPLFVSISPDALGPEQRSALEEAFTVAARLLPLAEPLDWIETSEPQKWSHDHQSTTYDWFGSDGVSPFST